MARGHAGSDRGQQRLIFPLLAEPTVRPRWAGGLVAGTVALALLSVAVLVAVSQVRPSPGKLAIGTAGTDGPEPRRAGNRGSISVFDLEPGTCLQDYDPGTDVREVLVVPCDVEHEAEVVASRRMPDGPWPGRDGIDEFATDRCVRSMRAAGVPPARGLRWSYVGPSATSWDSRDDRTLTCLVVGVDEPLIGSLIADSDDGTGREDDS